MTTGNIDINQIFVGSARIIYPNADVYEGEILNSKRHGRGILYSIHLGRKFDQYEGNFQNNYFHGEDEMKYTDGSIYKG
jgi:hypothetical protein